MEVETLLILSQPFFSFFYAREGGGISFCDLFDEEGRDCVTSPFLLRIEGGVISPFPSVGRVADLEGFVLVVMFSSYALVGYYDIRGGGAD